MNRCRGRWRGAAAALEKRNLPPAVNRYTSEDESQPSQIAPSQLYSQLSAQPPPPPPPASETAAAAAFAAAAAVSRLVAPLLHYCRSSPAAKSEARASSLG